MKFIKDFSYPPQHAVKDSRFCEKLLARMAIDAGTYMRTAQLLLQAKEGAQMWVTKEVSDDLQAADIAPEEVKFEELDWPAVRMEVYFEDPEIPSCLVVHATDAEQAADIGRLTGKPVNITTGDPGADRKLHEKYVVMQAEDEDHSFLSCTYTPEDFDRFATGELGDKVSPESLIAVGLNEEEKTQMRQLAILLFKVLLLASSEGHEIRRTREKPTKKQGGKPGFKNRPATERLIVEYLPRHRVERRQAAEKEGKSHKFNGRRGHWRRFNSPFFVNKRGQKRFIYPIPGPDGTVPRKKFVVRKPPISAPV
jgi:hypothetical protein